MKKILFITHDASKTGAPYVLYNFLKRVRENNEFDFEVLSLADGPMIQLFEELSKVFVFSKTQNLLKRMLNKLFGISFRSELELFLNAHKYDVYYINSSATMGRLPNFNFIKNGKSILHVHELDINIQQNIVANFLNEQIINFNHVICVSKLVRSNLIANYKMNIRKSSIIYPLSREIVEENISKRNLGLPPNAFVIGGCGFVEFTKGMDVFIQVAKKVVENEVQDKPIYFCWLGNHGNSYLLKHLYADIVKMGMEKKVKIIETTDNPESIFANFNLFFLSSREDSFPLVAIENSKMGKPVLCFNEGNGFVEFIDETNGLIVPYLDIDKTAEEILRLYNDKDLCESIGKKIKKDSIIFDNTIIYKQLVAVINEC